MSFWDYVCSKIVTLSFLGIGALFTGVFLAFAEVSTALIGMAAAIFLLLVGLWLLVSYLMERRQQKRLARILEELPEKYLLGEILPAPVNAVEYEYYQIMKEVSRSAVGVAEQAVWEKEEYCDYVESWIHEIKTPLTACSLILANGGDISRLKCELKRADNLTESILYYARMRTAGKETQIREIHAADVIEEAVKSQMEILIAARISVEIEGDFAVHTDERALCFILKQLLVNCAKYCPKCHVSITARGRKIMLEDDGIGIPSHEIRRVTERGFTGSNGQRIGGSTGMGLYIVKELCGRLDIDLQIESKQGEFTRVTLGWK
ncbi:MAG: sensor histidine kinase [Lachnospiraceae bacterium]|nr:sensor histidine kinase [Lachnospiraceae bacterium]